MVSWQMRAARKRKEGKRFIELDQMIFFPSFSSEKNIRQAMLIFISIQMSTTKNTFKLLCSIEDRVTI